ncbi:MAG: RecQ family ATP-dependent DNA helicase [Planctomycetes bacterium]|nr:RecQ family ATP-dependent DNA helicase [Planctomycetota bacterium]
MTSGASKTGSVRSATNRHFEHAAPAGTPRELLRRVFGFDEFRDGQQAVIERLLAGKNVLSVFPTGGGKSLCYELPSLMFDGLTVVISPLIALMKDQVGFLRGRSVPAARLDSSLERDDVRQVYEQLNAARLKLLYVSPERLGSERFLHLIGRRRISLLAIDEAHCISEWGHNFRPDYLKIARLAKRLHVERVLTLTATATPEVAADIAREFDIADADIVHTGFYRPNLTLRITPCSADERPRVLLSRTQERPAGPTIVYVTLQRTAEEVARFLSDAGYEARAYHAGMDADARNAVQDAFMASDRMTVVATIAFGMGIDKSDIRYVYHYNLPKGMESYMQEIGRAGRDGAPSTCELLACADDVITLENFSYGDTPTPQDIAALLAEILSQDEHFDVSIYELSQRHDVRPLVVETLLAYLELEDVIHATGPFYTGFKFQPQRSSQEILGSFDPQRAAFLRAVLQHARKGRTWFALDADEVARAIGEPRERIVKALGYLEEKGDLLLQASGLRQGFRRTRASVDRNALEATIVTRFARREAHDIARIRRVCDWAEHYGCLTKRLLEYFGETRSDCGHCSRCDGQAPRTLPSTRRPLLGEAEAVRLRELRTEGHDALNSPRQLTRFLCGLSSPATTRAKLRGHRSFGLLASIPFADVLAFVERHAVK